jgi:dTDP-4-amino-4,6-dideoxygalactose transaminase
MDRVLAVARRHRLTVIEDAAQAHGAEYNGRRAGSLGDIACFSFYPGKNLGAYGEGGMVVTDNPQYVRAIRMLRDWGAERKYHHVLKGYNYRLETIQAAVLRVKLRYIEKWTEARRSAAARYDRLLADSGIATPRAMAYARHVYHIYAVRTKRRAAWQEALAAQGIQTGIHYPTPVHLLPAFEDLGYRAGQFPHSERAANEVLSLPMYPEITPAQCEAVATALCRLASTEETTDDPRVRTVDMT